MSTTVTMPQLGESVVEGTVGKWLVREGDVVKKDQAVVEILTDKADSEVPTPVSGVIERILVSEGALVRVGEGLCQVNESAKAQAPEPLPVEPQGSGAARPAVAPPQQRASSDGGAKTAESNDRAPTVPASPAARKLAREHGIDLAQMSSSGGRITKQDVLRAKGDVEAGADRSAHPGAKETNTTRTGKTAGFQVPPYIPRPGDEVVPFSRRRRIIADHMVHSKVTSPHVMAVAECDLKRTSAVRDAHKAQLKKEGVNLTFLAFVASAVARALREHRELNARVLDDSYVLLRDIHLGIAVDTPEGLVVPVVKSADELTVRGIARAIDELANRARDNKLTPDDLAGKTFTISNPGKKGNLFGAAIISQPNVGILRVGEIQKRVVVVEHEDEDLMAIHPVMYMALSYDHRIVDGVAANGFLHRVVEILEQGDFDI